MEMLSPDFTMSEECCKVDNDARVVWGDNQVITFDKPVFADTIDISTFGTTINSPYVLAEDWVINDSDLDKDTMSMLRLERPGFNKRVVKSITSIRSITDGTEVKLALKYQTVYPTRSKLILYKGEPVVASAPLLREMLSQMDYLSVLTRPVENKGSAPYLNSPRLLEEDAHKTNSKNFITGELHEVNVPNGRLAIKPVAGAFFKDSVTVKYVLPTNEKTELVPGKDYIIEGVDYHRTGYTQNPSGVYNFIFLISAFVGTVEISYHAYGGQITIEDGRALSESMNNIITFLNEQESLTTDSLGEAAVIKQLTHAVYHLEENMRRMLMNGKPSYGDTTTGHTLLKKISAQDADTHWWTIATLYKVDTDMGSSEVVTADEFRFRMKARNFGFMLDVLVSVNLFNEDRVLSVTTLNDNSPTGYTPFVNYNNVDKLPKPQLRVIYNHNGEMNSGIALQLGMSLPGTLEETICIEDISGKESCWKLTTYGSEDMPYNDNIVVLPNSAHTWDKTNSSSRYESTLIPFKNGHLIWAGSEVLNRPAGKVIKEIQHFLDDNVDISTISKVRVELEEAGGMKLAYEIPFITGVESKYGNISFQYNGSPAYINAFIRRDELTKNILVTIEADSSAGSSGNQLFLRHILLIV